VKIAGFGVALSVERFRSDNRSMPIPNSLPWMESVDAKMIRAHEHLETFAREVDEYLSTIRLHMYLKTAPGQPNPWLLVHANDYIPPIRLSTIAGDCVHNMRSALDNLICGLALTVYRSCNCKDTKFPFTENEADWNANSPKRLAGIPSEAVNVLRMLQCWCDPVKPSPLQMLNKLNNMDEHRHCAFGLGYSQSVAFRVYCLDGNAVNIWPKEALYLGDVHTFDVPVPAALIGPSARVEASGNFVITFRDEGPWGDLHVTDVLHRCFDHIETKVIANLKRFFEPVAQ
jgi:hypothetical protein